jgi:hypothetical protein
MKAVTLLSLPVALFLSAPLHSQPSRYSTSILSHKESSRLRATRSVSSENGLTLLVRRYRDFKACNTMLTGADIAYACQGKIFQEWTDVYEAVVKDAGVNLENLNIANTYHVLKDGARQDEAQTYELYRPGSVAAIQAHINAERAAGTWPASA